MAINFRPGEFTKYLSEGLGLKSGLILQRKDYASALDHNLLDDLDNSEYYGIRIRSEDYENIFYRMLSYLGVTKSEYSIFDHHRKLKNKYKSVINYDEMFDFIFDQYKIESDKLIKYNSSSKILNPNNITINFINKFDGNNLPILIDILKSINTHLTLSPYNNSPSTEQYKNNIELKSLFENFKKVGDTNIFFDQRFIQFISKNPDLLEHIHWRKFEELTAEYFIKDGWEVFLEKGTDDDGVDLRVSKEINTNKQTGIIQCKRVKSGVDKVTVKGLYADIEHLGADFGVVVTSSHLTPGAKKTINTRKYPINYAENKNINQWIEKMRVPYIDEYIIP